MPDIDSTAPLNRKQHILQALAAMLEAAPNTRITTAKLAASVGVSEAALYRHFPSKTKMFEGLIAFAEETLFSRIGRLSEEQVGAVARCSGLLRLYIEFCERNPGITRLLTGRALTGEASQLHHQVAQLYDRLETTIIFAQAELREGIRTRIPVTAAANLLLASAEGKVNLYCRSDFSRPPTEGWADQWRVLTDHLMKPVVGAD